MTPHVLHTPPTRGSNSRNRRRRTGLTTPELLVAALILAMLMLAAFSLFKASWQSYDNLVWQTKVNMEARQALDDICDMLRNAGNDVDMTRPDKMTEGQVDPSSTSSRLTFFNTYFPTYQNYQTFRSNRDNIYYLTRFTGANLNTRVKIGQYIRSIELEYEYRLPSSDADPVWHFERVNNPSAIPAAAFLATTVYVTVKAEAQPYPNGTIYKRTLTGALRLRGPYGLMVPPSQYLGWDAVLPDEGD
jgi:hypothetical protein